MQRLLPRFLSLLLLLFCVTRVPAQQRMVLLETFTNSYDACPGGNVFDQEWKETLSQYGSKVIHLNHHIGNVGDPMAQSGGANGSNVTAATLSGSQDQVFMTAVDRTDFSPNKTTTSQSEWESRVASEASKSPSATISLVDATFDKSTHILHAIVKVTASKAIPNPVAIHYAITQDNVSFDQCGGTGPSTHNNVVRYVTIADSAAFSGSVQSGESVNVTYNQFIKPTGNGFDIKQMKLIAFLVGSGGNVVNAAILKKNFDTLQAPVQTLAFVDASINGKVYHPGENAIIEYTSSNIQYADAYYSLDNGSTWNGFTTSVGSPITWVVPDSATTQGKFKLIGPDGVLEATQSGNFTIASAAHSLTLLHPTSTDTGHTLLKFVIQWRKVGIDAVKLESSLDGGAIWTTISESVTDTFYNWTVPNVKTNQAQIRITPLGVSDVASITSPQFTITGGLSVRTLPLYPLQLVSVFPNPATNGSQLQLEIKAPVELVNVQVLDLLGKVVYRMSGYVRDNGRFNLPTNGLVAGTYILHISDGISNDSKRIVIQ
jgi:hypothetical protein